MFVCVSVRSGPVSRTSLQRLKLRTSNLTSMYPGTVRIWPLKFFWKGDLPRSRDPQNFWVLIANSSKTVKATDYRVDNPDMTTEKFFEKGRL